MRGVDVLWRTQMLELSEYLRHRPFSFDGWCRAIWAGAAWMMVRASVRIVVLNRPWSRYWGGVHSQSFSALGSGLISLGCWHACQRPSRRWAPFSASSAAVSISRAMSRAAIQPAWWMSMCSTASSLKSCRTSGSPSRNVSWVGDSQARAITAGVSIPATRRSQAIQTGSPGNTRSRKRSEMSWARTAADWSCSSRSHSSGGRSTTTASALCWVAASGICVSCLGIVSVCGIPSADFGGIGGPVSGGGALPGDGDRDVDAEHPGEDRGGQLGGEVEQGCRAGGRRGCRVGGAVRPCGRR